MEDFSIIMELIQTIGMWSVFAYLYVSERNRRDVDIKAHMDDLRDVAGIRASLRNGE